MTSLTFIIIAATALVALAVFEAITEPLVEEGLEKLERRRAVQAYASKFGVTYEEADKLVYYDPI